MSKILLIIAAVQLHEVFTDPLFGGISFQRGFEINFKPWPIKPIAFIREKWSPMGVFGKKFAIQKRSIDNTVPMPPLRYPKPAAPVCEHIDEIQMETAPLLIIPKPAIKPPGPTDSPKPPPIPLPVPVPAPMPVIMGELPPLPHKSEAIPPISTNMVIIQPTKVINSHVSGTGLHTDITRAETIKHYIDPIKPHSPSPVHVTPVQPAPPVHKEPESSPPVDPIPPPPIETIPSKPVETVHPHPAEPVPPPSVEPGHSPSIEPATITEETKVEPQPPEVTQIWKHDNFLKENSFIKGSKMALQFGTVFLTLMAQFFQSARATIDQMTNPPPVFNN